MEMPRLPDLVNDERDTRIANVDTCRCTACAEFRENTARLVQDINTLTHESEVPPTEPELCPPVTRASDDGNSTRPARGDGNEPSVDLDSTFEYVTEPASAISFTYSQVGEFGPALWLEIRNALESRGYREYRSYTNFATYQFVRPERRVPVATDGRPI